MRHNRKRNVWIIIATVVYEDPKGPDWKMLHRKDYFKGAMTKRKAWLIAQQFALTPGCERVVVNHSRRNDNHLREWTWERSSEDIITQDRVAGGRFRKPRTFPAKRFLQYGEQP